MNKPPTTKKPAAGAAHSVRLEKRPNYKGILNMTGKPADYLSLRVETLERRVEQLERKLQVDSDRKQIPKKERLIEDELDAIAQRFEAKDPYSLTAEDYRRATAEIRRLKQEQTALYDKYLEALICNADLGKALVEKLTESPGS